MTLSRPAAVILDIEGTTTPIQFVHDVLFPYARARMAEFFTLHAREPWMSVTLATLAHEAQADAGAGAPQVDLHDPSSAPPYLLWQMDRDRKATTLKAIQGQIWDVGYAEGALKGPVWPDVVDLLDALAAAQIPAYIYSSGSVAAQKLIFGHSDQGDLRDRIAGYFDTTTGPKKEAASYLAIAQAIHQAPPSCLFATDNPDEARAASTAGMQVMVMNRPGNAPLPADLALPTYTSFAPLTALIAPHVVHKPNVASP
jgi:enolase-phosphatase E1